MPQEEVRKPSPQEEERRQIAEDLKKLAEMRATLQRLSAGQESSAPQEPKRPAEPFVGPIQPPYQERRRVAAEDVQKLADLLAGRLGGSEAEKGILRGIPLEERARHFESLRDLPFRTAGPSMDPDFKRLLEATSAYKALQKSPEGEAQDRDFAERRVATNESRISAMKPRIESLRESQQTAATSGDLARMNTELRQLLEESARLSNIPKPKKPEPVMTDEEAMSLGPKLEDLQEKPLPITAPVPLDGSPYRDDPEDVVSPRGGDFSPGSLPERIKALEEDLRQPGESSSPWEAIAVILQGLSQGGNAPALGRFFREERERPRQEKRQELRDLRGLLDRESSRKALTESKELDRLLRGEIAAATINQQKESLKQRDLSDQRRLALQKLLGAGMLGSKAIEAGPKLSGQRYGALARNPMANENALKALEAAEQEKERRMDEEYRALLERLFAE